MRKRFGDCGPRLKEEASWQLKHIKIDCVANIVRSRHLLTGLVWMLMLLTFASMCGWFMIQAILQYGNRSVDTTTRLINEPRPIFPTLTICSMNPFNTDYAAEMLRAYNMSEYLTGDPAINIKAYLTMNIGSKFATGSYLSNDQLSKMSSFDHMLIDCKYQYMPCSADDFEYIFHPFLIGCFRFNANGTKRVNMAGLVSPLSLQLYTGLHNNISSHVQQRGFYLLIQNATDYPYSYASAVTKVTPNLGSLITPHRYFFDKYEMPYSECSVLDNNQIASGYTLEDRSLFDAVVNTGYTYAQSTCILFCQQRLLVQHCKCLSSTIMYQVSEYGLCMTPEQNDCSQSFYFNFTTTDMIYDKCFPLCPIECFKALLETTKSYYAYPYGYGYLSDIQKENKHNAKFGNQSDFTNLERLKINLAQFDLYYETLTYTMISEEPKITFEVLIGGLGGHLHLFMGMSLMSFFEVIEFFLMMVKTTFDRKDRVESFRSNG